MDEERQLIETAQLWDKAMATNDVDQIGRFMSADWIIVASDGITSREDFLDSIRQGHVSHNRMDSDEVIAKIYEDTGVVISRGKSAGTFNGEPFDLYEWSTNVFVRQGESWRCAATMITPAKR